MKGFGTSSLSRQKRARPLTVAIGKLRVWMKIIQRAIVKVSLGVIE